MVDKGFRGEFLAKCLLCIAMEDTLRPTTERKKQVKTKWGYSRTVLVIKSLTNLFRNQKHLSASQTVADETISQKNNGIAHDGRFHIPQHVPELRQGPTPLNAVDIVTESLGQEGVATDTRPVAYPFTPPTVHQYPQTTVPPMSFGPRFAFIQDGEIKLIDDDNIVH
jgi:hypothetical protein